MRKTFTIALLLLLSSSAFATLWNVEVGGIFQQITPFYSPQTLNIEVGDTVLWTWTSGEHNVTSQSGPVSFASGDITAPGTYQFVFNTAGVYEYECTLFSHATTQFGTITVTEPVAIEPAIAMDVKVFPNPVVDRVKVDATGFTGTVNARICEVGSGKTISEAQFESGEFELSMADLATGRYLLLLSDGENKSAKMLQKF